jgi:cytochrome c-type biogenesis protein CcmH
MAAARAQGQLNRLDGAEPASEDWANEADLLILATGGYVSPEAETALERALALDPQNPTARFYAGLMHSQFGRPDLAFRVWRPLLEESAGDDPWVPPIREQIEDVAFRAGVTYELPPLPGDGSEQRGPSVADMAAAQDMSLEDRQAMIEGMVTQLSDRLAGEGGPPADWARLIRALGVLGRNEQAALIWREAQNVFTDPAALAPVRAAARDAGVARVTPD